MKTPHTLFCAILCFASCDFYDASVDIKLPEHEPRLVVNSILSTEDSVLQFAITKSVAASSSDNVGTRMENVQLQLLRNGVAVDGIYQDEESGVHKVNLRPTIGDHFELQVDAPGFETVYSEATVPDTCTILSVGRGGKRYDMDAYEYEALIIRLKDVPNTESYYAIELGSKHPCDVTYYTESGDSIVHLDNIYNSYSSFSTPVP